MNTVDVSMKVLFVLGVLILLLSVVRNLITGSIAGFAIIYGSLEIIKLNIPEGIKL